MTNPNVESSRLLINRVVLEDWPIIFGTGININLKQKPAPGESSQFGFDAGRYFPEAGCL
jgi:hypothetical protein